MLSLSHLSAEYSCRQTIQIICYGSDKLSCVKACIASNSYIMCLEGVGVNSQNVTVMVCPLKQCKPGNNY